MAGSPETSMNLSALQRLDCTITKIVDNATQVAMYKFSPEANEWEKIQIEGTFFVYTRSSHPQYGFIVINRLNTNNLIEPITEELEYQDQNPFLLYRNSKGNIYGIWFYGEENCARIVKLFKSLCKMAKKEKGISKHRVSSENGYKQKTSSSSSCKENESDIISILARAQNEFDMLRTGINSNQRTKAPRSNPLGQKNGDIVKPTPVHANNIMSNASVQHFSVDTLFAQSCGEQNFPKEPAFVNCQSTPHRSRSLSSVSHKESAKNHTSENAERILQRLLSNPAHTVEHIESKLQKSDMDCKARARSATCSESMYHANSSLASVEIMEKDLKEKLNILPKTCVNEASESSKVQYSSSCGSDCLLGSRESIQNLSDIPVLTPAMLENTCTVSSVQLGASENPLKCTEETTKPCSDAFAAATSVPLPNTLSTSLSSLLSPMDFATPTQRNNSTPNLTSDPALSTVGQPFLADESKHFVNTKCQQDVLVPQSLLAAPSLNRQMSQPVGITPLSKNQLREALSYMLQNDDEFLTKIHECYLNSLCSQLSNSKS